LPIQSLDAGVAKPGQQPFLFSKEKRKRLAERKENGNLPLANCLNLLTSIAQNSFAQRLANGARLRVLSLVVPEFESQPPHLHERTK